MGNNLKAYLAKIIAPLFLFGVKTMKTKFNPQGIDYIRITSIDEMDFENLPIEYGRQLAKGITGLIRNQDCTDDQEDE